MGPTSLGYSHPKGHRSAHFRPNQSAYHRPIPTQYSHVHHQYPQPFGVLEPPKHISMPFRLHLLLIHDLHGIEHHVYLQTWGHLSVVILKSFWLPEKSHHYLLSSCQILCLQTLDSTNIMLTTNPLGILLMIALLFAMQLKIC